MDRWMNWMEEQITKHLFRNLILGAVFTVLNGFLLIPIMETVYGRKSPVTHVFVMAEALIVFAVIVSIASASVRAWKEYRRQYGWYQIEKTKGWFTALCGTIVLFASYRLEYGHIAPHSPAEGGYFVLGMFSFLTFAVLSLRFVYLGIRSLKRTRKQRENDARYDELERKKIGKITEIAAEIGISIEPRSASISVKKQAWSSFSPGKLGEIFGSLFHNLTEEDGLIDQLYDRLVTIICYDHDGRFIHSHYTPSQQTQFLNAMVHKHPDVEKRLIAAAGRVKQQQKEQNARREWRRLLIQINGPQPGRSIRAPYPWENA